MMAKATISRKSKWLRLEENTWHNFEADLTSMKNVAVKPAKFEGQTRLILNVDMADGKGFQETEIPYWATESFDEAVGEVYEDWNEEDDLTIEMRVKRIPDEEDGKVVNRLAFQIVSED